MSILERLKLLDDNGYIVFSSKGTPRFKSYLSDLPGLPVQEMWTDISPISSQAKERTGYPTQKPLALLQRIIKASTNAGDVVLDPFCGCATTMVAAQQLDRKWIAIDIETKAAVQRLSDDAGLFKDMIHCNDLPQRTDVQIQKTYVKSVKDTLHKQQKGVCNGCKDKLDVRHFEVDHVIPKSRGGGDYIENYQLLCGNCNRRKGNKPMEFLRLKISKNETHLKTRITFGA